MSEGHGQEGQARVSQSSINTIGASWIRGASSRDPVPAAVEGLRASSGDIGATEKEIDAANQMIGSS